MMRTLVILLVLATLAWAEGVDSYTVVRGDTLYSIAKRFGTTAEALMQLNGLAGSGLEAGQVLKLPSAASSDKTTPIAQPTLAYQNYRVVRGDTLYSLSKEGKGTAGPLVTALTVATVEAAEELAVHSPGGRLATPMVGVLDEAANVCRWRELPNLYSHYGSRGIVLMTILQSWSQGVEVWGRDGMRKLWSASNIKVYGGGVAEAEFLNELAQLVGEYRYSNMTRSRSKQGTSYSHDDDRKERTLDVSDLAAFPRGRAIMFASGAPAALLETVPWMNGPHAEAVRASITAHDPATRPAAAAGNRWVTAGDSNE